MPKPVISYDKDLPEIPDRQPFLPPISYLRKKEGTKDEFEIVDGRRPSKMLLVRKVREAVDEWRADNYPEASDVSRRLFTYWFDEDHLVEGNAFKYYFGQREAIETLAYLVEVKKIDDSRVLIDTFAEVFYTESSQHALPGADIVHQTTIDGKRQIRRYVPEVQGETIQDLPPQNLRRYALKMATGSGKTVVMAMLIVWSYFQRKLARASGLSTNFLILAPNVIVYQRLEKDFASNNIFYSLPLIPPEWRGRWDLKVILRGESSEPEPSGNIFLTNIQQIYESRQSEWTPANAVEALLGRKPAKDLASQERSMLERIKSLQDLVIINDEAHHVHDEDLQWYKTLMSVHGSLLAGLSLWLDFSATPKDQNGTYFPWIICDYPLAQAVEDRIVKAPIIVHQVRRDDPELITRDSVIEAYGDWLLAALERWREHFKTYKPLGPKPVLFVMAERNDLADEIGSWLVATKENDLKQGEVLVIHTDKEGNVSTKELQVAREAARDIDQRDNKVKVIVSVLMLREGWDVRNVTVVLGLRPFNSKAEILPEQAVGRGLRLMQGISPDSTQTLEVLGTKEFENFVRRLETEGVGIRTVTNPPKPPVQITPVLDKIDCDISIPITRPVYTHNYRRLSEFDPLALDPIFDQTELDQRLGIRLKMEFAMTETEVHQVDLAAGTPPLSQEILASITNKVISTASLPGGFAELYPLVMEYVGNHCFGKQIDLEDETTRTRLRSVMLQEAIAKYLARKIGELTAEKRSIEFENAKFKLSDTTPFVWRRDLPLLSCKKTIFNLVATFNKYERDFAQFLDNRCQDIRCFASLGTTEQESGTRFRVDYLKPSGALGLYYPDWVAVQQVDGGEVNWIIETKGRVWESTPAKDAAICYWCDKVSEQTGNRWDYIRVNQTEFGNGNFSSFAELVKKLGATCSNPPVLS